MDKLDTIKDTGRFKYGYLYTHKGKTSLVSVHARAYWSEFTQITHYKRTESDESDALKEKIQLKMYCYSNTKKGIVIRTLKKGFGKRNLLPQIPDQKIKSC